MACTRYEDVMTMLKEDLNREKHMRDELEGTVHTLQAVIAES